MHLNSFHVPYRNLNNKAQKFAMVLSSLYIHGLNVLQSSQVILALYLSGCVAQLVVQRIFKQQV